VQCGSPVASPDTESERLFDLAKSCRLVPEHLGELTLQLLAPGWSEFDTVCDVANRICDRYQLTKTLRIPPTSTSSSRLHPET